MSSDSSESSDDLARFGPLYCIDESGHCNCFTKEQEAANLKPWLDRYPNAKRRFEAAMAAPNPIQDRQAFRAAYAKILIESKECKQ